MTKSAAKSINFSFAFKFVLESASFDILVFILWTLIRWATFSDGAIPSTQNLVLNITLLSNKSSPYSNIFSKLVIGNLEYSDLVILVTITGCMIFSSANNFLFNSFTYLSASSFIFLAKNEG